MPLPGSQLSLLFQAHSQTSKEAAEKAEPARATQRRHVWLYLVGCGNTGATDEEIQLALGMNPSTQRPRRIELVNLGAVVKSDGVRPTRSGRNAVVWIAHPEAT